MPAARNLTGEQWDVWRVNGDAEYIEDGYLDVGEEGGRAVPRVVEAG